MIIAGVTGGIGSGKTVLCKEWEKLGAKVIYADDLAKELMVNDPELREQLKNTFGDQTFNENGSLNRQYLIRHAFEEGRVSELNKLVHPVVADEFARICKEAEEDGEKMVVEEAALLLNKGRPGIFDVIVLVKSDRDNRIERVVKRDQMTVEKVLSRDKKQPDFDELTHIVDYTIENNGTLKELKEKSKKLFHLLTEKLD